MPDLELFIVVLEATKQQIRRLIEAARLAGYPVRTSWLRREIRLDGVHDLLTDAADWNAEYWDMHLDKVEPLVEALRDIYKLSPAGITVRANWAGNTPTSEEELSIDEMLNIVRNSRLGTLTNYVIRKPTRGDGQ